MRMTGHGPSAADLLNEALEAELRHWWREFADEPQAGRLAREIIRRRAREPFATSDHLVNAIRAVLGPRSGPGDFARIFQGLRIAVNRELERLAAGLEALRERLASGGTLAVISYHSGEDRVVKHSFREWSRACICPPTNPVCQCRGRPLGTVLTRRAVVPTAEELAANVRARSAKLRAFRRA
jgi:16S rRNA (cytosine1402-N4)-methyltransferase